MVEPVAGRTQPVEGVLWRRDFEGDIWPLVAMLSVSCSIMV